MTSMTTVRRTIFGALLTAAALLLWAPGAQAATIKVPQQEPSIQDAVDAASPGDTVLVQGRKRPYFENVVVTTNRLTIVGVTNRQGRMAVIDGTSRNGSTHDLVFDVDADDFTLRNVRSHHGYGIDCTGNGCTFGQVIVNMSDQSGDCLEIEGNRATVKRSRLVGCDDQNIDIEGDRFKVLRNYAIHGDNGCLEIDGDSGLIRGNEARICEDGEVLELNGNQNEIRDNFFKSADNEILEVDGHRNVLVGNRAANTDTTSGCIAVDGIRNRLKRNVTHSCGKGYAIDGENMKLIGNRAFNSSEDDGFEIFCSDYAGGAPEADACRDAVIRGNRSVDSGDDDEAFRIDDGSSGGGMTIVGNVSHNSYEEGFDLDVDDAVIRGNVSRRDGAEGNESGFDVCGTRNLIAENRAVNSGDDGIRVSCGNRNRIVGNLVKFANIDGIHLEGGTNGAIRNNRTILNNGDGIENDGTDTRIVGNDSADNRRDCANDGTIAVNRRNRCADGSNFERPGTVNRARPRGKR